MIETIAGLADTRRNVGRLLPEDWAYQRHPGGRQVWACRRPEKPEGVSAVILSETPVGDRYLTLEGNLTAALYGSRAAVGSLRVDQVQDARDRLFSAASEWAGLDLPDPHEFRLSRVDPSATYRVAKGVSAFQVVRAYADAFLVLATGRAVAQRTDSTHGATALLRLTKARSWQVYDKGAEARTRGIELGSAAVRCEPRVRPNKINSGHWKGIQGTMAIEAAVMDASDQELREMLAAVQKITGATAVALMGALQQGGASPNEAARLVGAALVAEGGGWETLQENGVPERTWRRWRADFKRYLEAAGVELDDLAQDVGQYLGSPLYAEDVAAAERLAGGSAEDVQE